MNSQHHNTAEHAQASSIAQAIHALNNCLQASISDACWSWLNTRRRTLKTDFSDKALHITLGMIPRKLGREDLQVDSHLQASMQTLIPGWKPQLWSVDTAARVLVITDLANSGRNDFGELYTELCRTADLNEQIALYQATALLEPSEALDQALGDGLRTSIQAVFEAIAHNNPYPSRAFDTHRWNHMVLKALFIDSTLHPIVGLDERANTELATILCDYAHERWAAGRTVTPELWRCVGPHTQTDDQLNDLLRALNDNTPGSAEGALLALSAGGQLAHLLPGLTVEHQELLRSVTAGDVSWSTVYSTYIKPSN